MNGHYRSVRYLFKSRFDRMESSQPSLNQNLGDGEVVLEAILLPVRKMLLGENRHKTSPRNSLVEGFDCEMENAFISYHKELLRLSGAHP